MSDNVPQWGRGPEPRRPGRPGRQWRSGWRPQDWSVKRGLAVGLSGFFVLVVIAAVFGGGNSQSPRKKDASSSRPAAAAVVTTRPARATTATPSPTPSPTRTLPTLPDFTGAVLQSAQDQAQALGFHDLASRDLTGQGRHQVLDADWRVCSQNPGPVRADPSTTTVTFGVVKDGESCSQRGPATPPTTRPAPTPTHTATHAPTHAPTHSASGGSGASRGTTTGGGSGGSTGGSTGGSSSGGTSSATCAAHTVGVCAAGSPHPAGATAQCSDGTYSYSASFRGTCSHHGGVRLWYK